jgi:hypothetical protein
VSRAPSRRPSRRRRRAPRPPSPVTRPASPAAASHPHRHYHQHRRHHRAAQQVDARRRPRACDRHHGVKGDEERAHAVPQAERDPKQPAAHEGAAAAAGWGGGRSSVAEMARGARAARGADGGWDEALAAGAGPVGARQACVPGAPPSISPPHLCVWVRVSEYSWGWAIAAAHDTSCLGGGGRAGSAAANGRVRGGTAKKRRAGVGLGAGGRARGRGRRSNTRSSTWSKMPNAIVGSAAHTALKVAM